MSGRGSRISYFLNSGPSSALLGDLRGVRTVLLEDSRGRKFTKLVPHHVFRHEDGVKNFAVVDQEGMTHKVRRNHRAARPCLDRLLHARIIHLLDFVVEMSVNERTFFQRATHKLVIGNFVTWFSSSTCGVR